jgi:hypothetical protein
VASTTSNVTIIARHVPADWTSDTTVEPAYRGTVFTGIGDCETLITALEQDVKKNCRKIKRLNVCGHAGNAQGGASLNPDFMHNFDATGLSSSQIARLRRVLADDGEVWLYSCSQGKVRGTQRFAYYLGRTIHASPYEVYKWGPERSTWDALFGDPLWNEFKPGRISPNLNDPQNDVWGQ